MSWAEEMSEQSQTRSDVLRASPPMFESRLLDSLSRVHPSVPVLIFAPAIVALAAWQLSRQSAAVSVGLAAAGYALWTLFEYWLHRLVFHFEPQQGLGARLHWIIHGVHHDHPNDPLRLVMPPAVSVPLGALVFALLYLIFGSGYGPGVSAGFFAGYLAYDLTHYYLHHFRPRHWEGCSGSATCAIISRTRRGASGSARHIGMRFSAPHGARESAISGLPGRPVAVAP